ncbi:MAG TPA: glycosyl hydrolase family 28-related protein [Opitutaceae bacterium]|jgi:polygalacturonase
MIRSRALALLLLAGCVRLAVSTAQAYDVAGFGAKGDGKADDTAAINAAIAAASRAGGGTVEFGPGNYLAGSIHLRSHVNLHLGAGSVIVATENEAAYDKPEPNSWGDDRHYQDFGHSHWHDSLIWGEDLVDVSITGQGEIFGKGLNRGHQERDHLPQGVGNKAIALKNCRNVLLRDFTIAHGGWFGILATGVDNLTIDNLRIDTNRDGMDIDCCHNVRVSNCSVNSPWDDGICLKSSFGLGQFRSTENVTISDCLVSGYDEGTLLDGTRKHDAARIPEPTGRIKFGTESNGGFIGVTVTNCVFECCRGLALETVDGADLEDVTISNISMRRIFQAPIFVRLGERMRGPGGTPVGILRRVVIGNVTADGVEGGQGILIAGLPGHAIKGLELHDVRMRFAGGGTAESAKRVVPELEREYPEPGSFGATPGWALYARHARDLALHDVSFEAASPDGRPAIAFDDVSGADLGHVTAKAPGGCTPIVTTNSAAVSLQGVVGGDAGGR